MDNEKISILIVEPEKMPRPAVIDFSIEAMQQVVGGRIEAIYPFSDDSALVGNDIAKLIGLPPNRFLRRPDGKACDIICGTFFMVGCTEEDFTSLTQEQMEYFKRMFSRELILTRHKSHGRGR